MENQQSKFTNTSARIIAIADAIISTSIKRHLKEVEVAIIQGSCQKWNYTQIAQHYGYAPDYLRNDAGPKLWKLISSALAKKVTKNNFRRTLEQTASEQFQNVWFDNSFFC